MTVLEKLLVPEVSQRVVEQGYDGSPGAVYRPDDLIGLTPGRARQALGLDGEDGPFGEAPDHVDVIRFGTNPLMDLRVPTNAPGHAEVPWPTYPTGFLRNAAPVWILTLTRCRSARASSGSASTARSRSSRATTGPRAGGRAPRATSRRCTSIGPRAKLRRPRPALLLHRRPAGGRARVGRRRAGPRRLHPVRPRVHARVVPVAECEVFDIALVGRWRERRVRVLQQAGDEALVRPHPGLARRRRRARRDRGGARHLPGDVPAAELTRHRGRALRPDADPASRHPRLSRRLSRGARLITLPPRESSTVISTRCLPGFLAQ